MRGEQARTTAQLRRSARLGGFLLAALVLAALQLVVATPAEAALGDYRCADSGRVYHGNPRLIRRPAVVSADQIFAQISEYQEILREGLTDKDVRYHFLMKEASKKFSKAVKAAARSHRHDFVAEEGAVLVVQGDAPPPPDRTREVIDKLG